MMYPPYSPMATLPKKRVEYHYCIQLGRHFRLALGQPCPDEEALNRARRDGERINIISVDDPNDIKWPIWRYPYGSEQMICVAVDRQNTVRRLYIM